MKHDRAYNRIAMDVAAVVNAVAVVMIDVNVNLRGVDELAGHMARHHLDHSARLAGFRGP